MNEKRYTVSVDEDKNGDLILPLPEELLVEMGWGPGDTLKWNVNKDGTFTLTKVVQDDTDFVLVEAVSMFRTRYVIEVPKGKKDYALDTVVCKEAGEFSQEWMDETIMSHRVISRKEILSLCDEDNSYAADWSEEQKMGAFVTTLEDLRHKTRT